MPIQKNQVNAVGQWPVLKPSHIIKAILDSGLRKALLPSSRKVREFWKVWLQDHPDDEMHNPEWDPYLHRLIPLQLWGDEGTNRENSWMMLTMISLLSPDHVRCLSQASRHLLFTFPVDLYAKSKRQDKEVNKSIQMLLREITNDLNGLYDEGVVSDKGLYFARVVNLKGDWKFLVQALNLVRSPSHDKICPFCEAGKKDPALLFTDTRECAGWKNTLFASAPWKVLPELMLLRGFGLGFISFDLMHTWHLGCGRDLAASTIKELVKQRVFVGNSTAERLQRAFTSLDSWARNTKHRLALRKLTKENLYWYSGTCPATC